MAKSTDWMPRQAQALTADQGPCRSRTTASATRQRQAYSKEHQGPCRDADQVNTFLRNTAGKAKLTAPWQLDDDLSRRRARFGATSIGNLNEIKLARC